MGNTEPMKWNRQGARRFVKGQKILNDVHTLIEACQNAFRILPRFPSLQDLSAAVL